METLITRLAAAANMRALYPPSHPRVKEAMDQIMAALAHAVEEQGRSAITILIVGDDLVIEHDVVRKMTLSQRQFVHALKRRGIERLTLTSGLTAGETSALVEALAGAGPVPKASAHVVFGQILVGAVDPTAMQNDQPRDLAMDHLEVVREAFARFRGTRTLPFAAIEQLVWGFVDSLSRSTRAILPLAKLKEHDEYTFVHSVNVSLLVLAQARSFGIEGTMLHAFGMAGLLHDIGKLTVPLAILNRPGRLDGEEWQTVQAHAEEGAWCLSELEGTLPLSIAVAYEHHLRYDGQPGYPVLRTTRIPNLASRMTSIADAFDAMMTVRPYQKPLLRSAAQEILSKRTGTFYDPLLVGNFLRIMKENS
jgi:HD-GYP domain-containing protein (c-di-GMP phosphodiesterase class II)